MIKPFQLLWELIEFGLQALFLYVLAVILCIGLIAYTIANNAASRTKITQQLIYSDSATNVEYGEKVIEEKVKGMPVERQCIKIAGCKIKNDGSIEWN